MSVLPMNLLREVKTDSPAPRVLVVSNDASSRRAAQVFLETAGIRCDECKDLDGALRAVESATYEAILVDGEGQATDGFECCKRIRGSIGREYVPVLITVTAPDTRTIEKACASGVTDLVTKPVNWPLLLYRLKHMLRATQAKAELARIEARFEATRSHLLQTEKMASIGQLAAGVAHEINNPIGYVNSNLATLEHYLERLLNVIEAYREAERSISDAGVRARLHAAAMAAEVDFIKKDLFDLVLESREGISRVRKIVQDLKDFSRTGSRDEWSWADLHAGLDSTINIASNEIKYKARLVKEYGCLPAVECLPSQLNQVFMNMLFNAAQAIEDRGTITVRTGTRADGRVCIEIADTGVGIPAANLNRIFDPFFTTKPVGKGCGLGLSLSYGIVKKHQGDIEVVSAVGRGTTFRIILPVQQRSNAPVLAQAAA